MSRRARAAAAAGSAVSVALALVIAFHAGSAGATTAPTNVITVSGGQFVDERGREVVLRGFNVSGETKLAENGGLPFASTADARRSAVAMRQLTGANAVRFLLSWAAAEPVRGQLDEGYLSKITDQMRAFLDEGFAVLPDYHQDLYSRYLFNSGSWYTGDGAPAWVVAAGQYPKEFCGICVQWGQNITQNAAVQDASADFWRGRSGYQDAFLAQAEGTLRYIRQHLTAGQFARIAGFDPFNEPYAGRYDQGQDSAAWERDVLWPFYLKFRARMDAAGWQDKPAFVEPNMFWNANLDFERQPGGLAGVGTLGPRFVFNAHFYDQKALSGVFMWGKAADGQYTGDFAAVRERATALGTASVVSEFGSPVTGYTSDKTPTVLKAMYQGLDSRLRGAEWWARPAESGPVLSGTQWQWDIYNGAHHELMNGNPDRVQTAGDAWNGEDFSVVDSAGPRLDARVLDRVYPAAVAGHTLAFTYEDRSHDGGATLTWNPVPATVPGVRDLVGTGQYAVLVWRSGTAGGPTELRLPASFTGAATVVSDAAVRTGPRRLLLTAGGAPGALHYALVANGPAPSDSLRAAAQRELAAWAVRSFS
jgi:hypothetical protein